VLTFNSGALKNKGHLIRAIVTIIFIFQQTSIYTGPNMIDEPFAQGSTVIHRLDPRYRIVAAAALTIAIAVAYRFQALAFALLLAILLVLAARLDLKKVGSRLWVIAGFLALIWVVVPITYTGDILFRAGPLTLSYQGISLSAQITLKSIAILFIMIALTTTMSVATLGHALDRLKVPGKIVHLLLISYRYVFVIEQEYKRIVRAARIRGFSPGTNLHTYRTVAYMIGMLFVRAALRADRVYHAMLLRGFNGRFYCLSRFPPHRRNQVFAVIMGCLLAGFSFLEWGPGL